MWVKGVTNRSVTWRDRAGVYGGKGARLGVGRIPSRFTFSTLCVHNVKRVLFGGSRRARPSRYRCYDHGRSACASKAGRSCCSGTKNSIPSR